MPLGPRIGPVGVLAPWLVEGTGCSARLEHVLKEGAGCKGLNGHKLCADSLIVRQAPLVGYVGLADLGSPEEVRFLQTTTEECFQ